MAGNPERLGISLDGVPGARDDPTKRLPGAQNPPLGRWSQHMDQKPPAFNQNPSPYKLFKGLIALLKISATAVLAIILGVWLISKGDRQSIVTGCGALLVAV